MSATFEELLDRYGVLAYKTCGRSMKPMLRQNGDLVVIRAPASRLKKYDVALYKRGEAYVLHRVIGVEKDAYRIRGDNTYVVEHVPDSDVIGVLTAFRRNGKEITARNPGYVLYSRLWLLLYPARVFYCRFVRRTVRAARRRAVRAAQRTGLLPALRKLLGRGRRRAG